MTQGKFHVNKETGKSGACDAKIKCPLGEDTPHFNTEKEAKEYITAMEAKENDTFTTMSKSGGAGRGGDAGGNKGTGGGGSNGDGGTPGDKGGDDRAKQVRELQQFKDQALYAREAAAKASDKLDALNKKGVGDNTPTYQKTWNEYREAKQQEAFMGEKAKELQDRLDGKPVDPNRPSPEERDALRKQENALSDSIAVASERYSTAGDQLQKLHEMGKREGDHKVRGLNATMDEARKEMAAAEIRKLIIQEQMERRMSPEDMDKEASEAEDVADACRDDINYSTKVVQDMKRYKRALDTGDGKTLKEAREQYSSYFSKSDSPEETRNTIESALRENRRSIADATMERDTALARAAQYRSMIGE